MSAADRRRNRYLYFGFGSSPFRFSERHSKLSTAMAPEQFFYLRNPRTAVMGDAFHIVAVDQNQKLRFLRRNVEEIYRILALLRDPLGLGELSAILDMPQSRVESSVKMLVREQLLVSGSRSSLEALMAEPMPRIRRPECGNLVFCISGTIQAASMITAPFMLKGGFAEDVDVVLTQAATKFLLPEVASYFGLRVWSDAFSANKEVNVPHIWLASRADLVVVAPASAHTIHRLATGECSDLLSLVVSATSAPVVVAPSMNPTMLASPPIRRNLQQLRKDGVYVVEPGLGFEVSNTSDGKLRFGPLGIGEAGIVPILRAVLASSKTRSEKNRLTVKKGNGSRQTKHPIRH